MRAGKLKRWFGAWFLMWVFGSTAVLAFNAEDPLVRLDSVGRLLNESSAAKQILDSNNSKAQSLRLEAVALYQRARESFAQDQYEQIDQWLDESTDIFFAAVHLSSGRGEEKALADMDRKRESIQALMQAHERVAGEKGREVEHRNIRAQVDKKLQSANLYLEEGDYSTARKEIEGAYLYVKVSLGSMREGDTLVRKLKFDSPAEEYVYELDRNDTHQMLVRLLVDKNGTSPETGLKTAPLKEKASYLRLHAERLAGSDDYAEAIKALELSTLQLIRVIRTAGVYIPN